MKPFLKKQPGRPAHLHVHGFTLLELLAAMTIVTVLVGISIATFSNVGGSTSIRGAIAELRSTLRFARMHAIANNEAVHVLFYGDRGGSDADAATRLLIYPNTRENYKFLKGYVCFAATQNKFVSDWKTLPPGLLFDPQLQSPEAGRKNMFALDKEEVNDYPGTTSTKPKFHKLTFLPDGTIAGTESLTIYLAEGATNAEEEVNGSKLARRIAQNATHFALDVFPLTGEVQVREVRTN
jgi:prepilin-type N-terminal cleavage/methylation domain-containing protein